MNLASIYRGCRGGVAGWVLGVVVAVATSCGGISVSTPTNMPIGQTITAEHLWEKFDASLPPGVWVAPLESSDYEVISARWMRQSFLPALRAQMIELWHRGLPKDNYAANCSGFAAVGKLMLTISAMVAHAHTPAVAIVIVKQDQPFGGLDATREDHCVAFVLTDEGPWIIEVQSAEYIDIADYPNREKIKLLSVH